MVIECIYFHMFLKLFELRPSWFDICSSTTTTNLSFILILFYTVFKNKYDFVNFFIPINVYKLSTWISANKFKNFVLENIKKDIHTKKLVEILYSYTFLSVEIYFSYMISSFYLCEEISCEKLISILKSAYNYNILHIF